MKIAQIAPLFESVPPKLYGGTERVVSCLTEELIRLGHEVVLFASGDSVTNAELVPCGRRSLRLDADVYDPIPHHIAMLEKVRRRASEFDILHFHTDDLHFPMTRALPRPSVTTLHGRLDRIDLRPMFKEFHDAPVVSISHSQRGPLRANYAATVHHGLPPSAYPFTPEAGDSLVFLGRIAPEKRPDRAIEIARRAGLDLKIAAKVGKKDRVYFEDVVRPLLRQRHVEFVGEVDEEWKKKLLGGALALLFPIDWPEPFGLVMIEAMACGTPVIAWRCGSAPEVVEDGVTGFLVHSLDEAVAAVDRARGLDRRAVRRRFEERFAARRMVLDYLEVYRALAAKAPDAALVA